MEVDGGEGGGKSAVKSSGPRGRRGGLSSARWYADGGMEGKGGEGDRGVGGGFLAVRRW